MGCCLAPEVAGVTHVISVVARASRATCNDAKGITQCWELILDWLHSRHTPYPCTYLQSFRSITSLKELHPDKPYTEQCKIRKD